VDAAGEGSGTGSGVTGGWADADVGDESPGDGEACPIAGPGPAARNQHSPVRTITVDLNRFINVSSFLWR